MIIFAYSVFLLQVCLFVSIDSFSLIRQRRQSVPNPRQNLPYPGWQGGSQNPSGGSPGAYYGTGNNPNYGEFRPPQHSAPGGNIHQVQYDNYPNAPLNPTQFQPQQPYYSANSNNYNSVWQRPSIDSNQNRPYNRYPPGSQGWYATGGNHWYNHGRSLVSQQWLLLISFILFLICT